MNRPVDARQIRQWQDAVANDPGSPAFLPLAAVYWREGRAEVARRLCLRGLERQPENVEAHVLLGRIYREAGDLERATDEFDIALRLDPEHGVARRSLGYLCLERRVWPDAVRHLERAAAQDPGDGRLGSALALARRHASAAGVSPPEEAAHALDAALERFLRESRMRLVLLLEGNGRIVARHGSVGSLDLAAVATLGAGIHSASREMARMLGQPAFEQLYQGTGERQLFLAPLATPIGERLLVGLFGDETNLGLVRVRFEEFVREASAADWYTAPRPVRSDAAAFDAELDVALRQARDANAGGDSPTPVSIFG